MFSHKIFIFISRMSSCSVIILEISTKDMVVSFSTEYFTSLKYEENEKIKLIIIIYVHLLYREVKGILLYQGFPRNIECLISLWSSCTQFYRLFRWKFVHENFTEREVILLNVPRDVKWFTVPLLKESWVCSVGQKAIKFIIIVATIGCNF